MSDPTVQSNIDEFEKTVVKAGKGLAKAIPVAVLTYALYRGKLISANLATRGARFAVGAATGLLTRDAFFFQDSHPLPDLIHNGLYQLGVYGSPYPSVEAHGRGVFDSGPDFVRPGPGSPGAKNTPQVSSLWADPVIPSPPKEDDNVADSA